MMSARLLLPAVTLGIVLLAGCAAPGGSGGPTSSPAAAPMSPTPTPTETTAPAAQMPPARTSATCEELLNGRELAALVGDGVEPASEAVATNARSSDLSIVWVARQLGGRACEWSNGVPFSSTFGTPPDYRGAQLRLIPVSPERWRAEYAAEYGVEGDRHAYCYAGPESAGICQLNALVADSWWLNVTVLGVTAPDDEAGMALAEPVFERAVAAVESSGPPSDSEPTLTGSDALPSECAGMIADADVVSALGLTEPVAAAHGGGGWGLHSEAYFRLDARPCYWGFLDRDQGVGELAWLPGGEWALRSHEELVAGHAETVPLDGLAAGDAGTLMCPPLSEAAPAPDPSAYCTLDFGTNGGWVRVVLWPDAEEHGSVPREEAIVTIAERILENVEA